MNKKNLAVILWFLAGWSGGSLFVGLLGMPSVLAFGPGLVLAALVWWDPTGLISSRSAQGRRVRPINEVAEELEKHIDQWPAVGADRPRT